VYATGYRLEWIDQPALERSEATHAERRSAEGVGTPDRALSL
jgi:hypothetical protein